MPIHDWTRVDAGIFHNFHQDWTIEICRTLNRGLLPADYVAMTDQRVDGPEPDVVTVRAGARWTPADLPWPTPPLVPDRSREVESDVAITPKGQPDHRSPSTRSCRRGHRGRIAGEQGQPPRDQGVHGEARRFPPEWYQSRGHRPVSPTPRDPAGIHQVIWDELSGVPFAERPADKPLTVASYDPGVGLTAYVDPLCVGDHLPDAALFLARAGMWQSRSSRRTRPRGM